MNHTSIEDPIDRTVQLARGGQPHNRAIAHLSETHILPATAVYLLEALAASRKDPDTAGILAAIRAHRDGDPASPTFGCYKWYAEDLEICDTNASFFTCTPLAALWLAYRQQLNEAEAVEFRGLFADVAPWFQKMAAAPSFYYPNKCISDAAMLLTTGHILADDGIVEAGRRFCSRYFDYYTRRGTGWGEDHSPGYAGILVEMAMLIMALEKSGPLFVEATHMTDAILEWIAFHDGVDAVPSIRGYNFECRIEVKSGLAGLVNGDPPSASTPLGIFARESGYAFHPRPEHLAVPRQRRWRTFEAHFSTNYIGPHARLGTLSHYPLMPNSYMHDEWGLGWQSKPASFIVGREEYGVLEWLTEDDEGVIRRHEAAGRHDWASRPLLKRVGFHPDVVFVGHQQGPAAIVLREIHRIHSPTRRIVDQWRLAHARGQILIGDREWDGMPVEIPPQWIVVRYANATVAIHPLKCRVPDKPGVGPTGSVIDLPLRLEKSDRGHLLSLPLVDGHTGMLTEPLLFSGWCVVLLDGPDDVGGLSLVETFQDDGEFPRTYGELVRTVELATPDSNLKIVRDMLMDRVERFIDGDRFQFTHLGRI